MRLSAGRETLLAATLLDPPVPRTDVLADVAAVGLRAELGSIILGNRRGRLRPVRETLVGNDDAGVVECARRARLAAERARTANELERRSRLDLGGGDERSEHHPRSVPVGDQHRVLAVEADA
jgi:hypothetical protein